MHISQNFTFGQPVISAVFRPCVPVITPTNASEQTLTNTRLFANLQVDLKSSQDKARKMNAQIANKIADLVQKNDRLRKNNVSHHVVFVRRSMAQA